MLDKLREAITAGRRAIDLLEAHLAELTSGQHSYIAGRQGHYDLAHQALRPYATALLELDRERNPEAHVEVLHNDDFGELHDSRTPAELLQLLRSTTAAQQAEWGAQGDQGYLGHDFDGLLDS